MKEVEKILLQNPRLLQLIKLASTCSSEQIKSALDYLEKTKK